MDETPILEFSGTQREYEEFIGSQVAKDLSAELNVWKQDLLHKLTVEDDVKEVYRHQGRVQMLDEILMLPYKILEQIIYERTK